MESLLLRLEAALGRLEAAAPLRTADQRLEAVVSRLEALNLLGASPAPAGSPPATAAAPAPSLGAPSASPPAPAAASAAGGVPGGSSSDAAEGPSVVAFRQVVEEYLPRIKASATQIGDALELSVEQLERALAAEEKVVRAIDKCKKPDQAGLQKLVPPLGEALGKANQLTEGKRRATFNHAKAVAESLSCLTWVLYTEKGCGLSMPGPHIDETWPSAEFYTNKILKENKNKEGGKAHVEFARALKELFTKGLRDYVKQFHLQGPSWRADGLALDAFLASGAGAGAGAAAAGPPKAAAKAPPPPPPKGPPPPPPPGGGPPPLAKAAGSTGSAPDMTKVFSALNQGEAVTAGLRKVTADMKTKNRADRTGFVATPAGAGAVGEAASPAKAGAGKVRGTPKLELQQDRKWVIEYQVGKRDIVLSETKPQQTVYIFGCKDSVVQVKGKVNAITLDKCTKTAIVFEDVVASCEIVNCTSVEVQCQGTAPCLAVDNTSGCQLYLGASALSTAVTTAKSSEVNVLVPGPSAGEELVEHALPEQFISEYKNGKFVTTPVTHSG